MSVSSKQRRVGLSVTNNIYVYSPLRLYKYVENVDELLQTEKLQIMCMTDVEIGEKASNDCLKEL